MNTQKRYRWAFLVCGAIAMVEALAADSSPWTEKGVDTKASPLMNALSVEPRVPRLGITPCVVELFRNLPIDNNSEEGPYRSFEYAPPAGCPGPWAKVILSVDLRGPGTTLIANLKISLGDERREVNWATELLVAGAQFNSGAEKWRVERDVTEYAAVLRDPRPGFAVNSDYYFRDPCLSCLSAIATGRLIFYPATAAQPAPEVPDAIYPINDGVGPHGITLPRNVERAYLDVYGHITAPWFSCLPEAAFVDYPILAMTPMAMGDAAAVGEGDLQGCRGSTYRDVLVTIDGQAAGVAPLYPWLNSDLNLHFERSVDVPVPTPQSINLMPYRVDLTPFAALLSDGTEHQIFLYYASAEGIISGADTGAQLLLYLDRGSQQVTGQVTRNTLAGSGVATTEVRNDWRLDGEVLSGDMEHLYRRQFEIAGYVDTSRGRVDSKVEQAHVLTNAQAVRVDGASTPEHHTYAQNLDLVSLTTRVSLRRQGAKVLALDKARFHYPLEIDYQATGGRIPVGGPSYGSYLERASAAVLQGHHQQGAYYRPKGTYADRVYANFAGSRAYDATTGKSSGWQGARSHYFFDSAGSCSRERVTWLRTTLTTHTQGIGCPNGSNRVRGFAHPDGSPDGLGWLR